MVGAGPRALGFQHMRARIFIFAFCYPQCNCITESSPCPETHRTPTFRFTRFNIVDLNSYSYSYLLKHVTVLLVAHEWPGVSKAKPAIKTANGLPLSTMSYRAAKCELPCMSAHRSLQRPRDLGSRCRPWDGIRPVPVLPPSP